jgi:hypothetical protein
MTVHACERHDRCVGDAACPVYATSVACRDLAAGLEGMGTVERAMVQRASRNPQVIGIAEDAGCDPVWVAAVVVRAMFLRP